MRRVTLSPLMVPPAVSRGWRYGIALFLAVWFGLGVRSLIQAIRRIHDGEAVYGRTVFDSFVVAYLAYLLIRIFLVPLAFEKDHDSPSD